MKITVKSLVLLCAAMPLLVSAAPAEPPGQTNAATAVSPPAKPEELFADKIVAKGKDVEVKRSQLDSEVINEKSMYAARGLAAPLDLEAQALNGMIFKQLVLNMATAADKAAGKAKMAESLQKFKTSSKLTEEAFNQRLNQQLRVLGMTREQWEQQNTDQATAQVVIEREMKVNVTDEQAKNFYDENPAKFEQPEMVRASHILLGTRDQATNTEMTDEQKAARKKQMEDILKRARAGEDFAKLAKEYSEDPGSKDIGGEYTFPRGRMAPEFEAAAFSMNTNQISDIITTQFGYHIIKLSEKIPAKKLEFDKVKNDIKEFLSQQGIQKQLPEYVAKLKKAAGVEILDEKLKPAAAPPEAAPETPAATNSPAKPQGK